MASPPEHLPDSDDEINPSIWEDVVHLEGWSINTAQDTLGSEIRDQFKNVWETQAYSDITLCAGNTEFNVHKLVLAAHSSYLEPKLSEPRICLDLEPEVLRLVLCYLYEGQVDVPEGNTVKVREAAELMGIECLQTLCRGDMLKGQEVTTENCLEMWEVGNIVKDGYMASRGLEMALKHLQTIQYSPHFLNLSFEHIMEYLLHPRLNVQSPEERMSASRKWTLFNPVVRLPYFATILEILPLAKMEIWLLQETLHNPVIASNKDVCALLEKTLHEYNRESSRRVEGIYSDIPEGETCLVTACHRPYKDGKPAEVSDEVVILRLKKGIKVESIGRIGCSYTPPGVKCVANGKSLYIGGLGHSIKDVYQFKLDRASPCIRTGSLVGSFIKARQFHGMCFKDGLIYIFGGSQGRTCSLDSIEIYDSKKASSKLIGSLKHFNILCPKGFARNLSCLSVTKSNDIIIGGAILIDKKNKSQKYKHIIQIFSTSKTKVTHSIVLNRLSDGSIYQLELVDQDMLIVFCSDYTAIISMKDIKKENPGKCVYLDNFIVPNYRCGVSLSPDKHYILLVGGIPKPSQPCCHMYRASVQDILVNSSSGWEQMQGQWPLGSCVIYSLEMFMP